MIKNRILVVLALGTLFWMIPGCGVDSVAQTPLSPVALPTGAPMDLAVREIGKRGGAPVFRKEIFSQVQTIDRIYRSMTGPTSVHRIELLPGQASELLWVVGYGAAIVDEGGKKELPLDYMCHNNLSIRPGTGRVFFLPSAMTPTAGRLFTLAQGQLQVDLPEGYGVPLLSDQTVQFAAQVLNLNEVHAQLGVRQRIRIDFVRDSELTKSWIPLIPRAVFGVKLVEGRDGYFGIPSADVDPGLQGEGCQVGVDVKTELPSLVPDGQGRMFTGHWVVEPGREVNHTPVTKLLGLPYDTTLHYVAVHLHPFAEWIELRDVTAKQTVWRAKARQVEGRVGLADVEAFSDPKGVMMYKDHEYSLVSSYNNTSKEKQDAMATMFLYLAAKDLDLSKFR